MKALLFLLLSTVLSGALAQSDRRGANEWSLHLFATGSER